MNTAATPPPSALIIDRKKSTEYRRVLADRRSAMLDILEAASANPHIFSAINLDDVLNNEVGGVIRGGIDGGRFRLNIWELRFRAYDICQQELESLHAAGAGQDELYEHAEELLLVLDRDLFDRLTRITGREVPTIPERERLRCDVFRLIREFPDESLMNKAQPKAETEQAEDNAAGERGTSASRTNGIGGLPSIQAGDRLVNMERPTT